MNDFIIIILLIVGLFIVSITLHEGYGQDASIRASAGWIAGPNYGYDPITQFADQIAEMRANPIEYQLKYWGRL
jgi:hypothetical protein